MEESRKSTKKFLIIYSIAIFIFAVAMILIAAFSYDKVNAYAQNIRDQAEAENSVVESNLQAVTLENQKLNTKISEIEASKADVETELAASRELTKIVNYKRLEKTKELYEAIGAFNAKEYYKHLSPEDKALFDLIKE